MTFSFSPHMVFWCIWDSRWSGQRCHRAQVTYVSCHVLLRCSASVGAHLVSWFCFSHCHFIWNKNQGVCLNMFQLLKFETSLRPKHQVLPVPAVLAGLVAKSPSTKTRHPFWCMMMYESRIRVWSAQNIVWSLCACPFIWLPILRLNQMHLVTSSQTSKRNTWQRLTVFGVSGQKRTKTSPWLSPSTRRTHTYMCTIIYITYIYMYA